MTATMALFDQALASVRQGACRAADDIAGAVRKLWPDLASNQIHLLADLEAELRASSNGHSRAIAEFKTETSPGDDSVAPPFAITVYSARELATLELPRPADPVSPHTRAGMVTLLAGITGHGKSTFIQHEIRQAADSGKRVLVLDLEQHLASIQRVIREAGLTEADAVDYAPIPEGLSLERRSDQLDALEEKLAAKPYDLLAIDPFYKLHTADSNEEVHARQLVALLRGWIARYGFAILTATHCRKLPAGRNFITIDDLFGSSVFVRDPELVLGLQRFKDLSKLVVFKSREPGFEYGQMFEFLFNRERGFYPKPTVDPEERAAKLETTAAAAVAYIADHPGCSTNKVRIGVADALKCGRDLVEEALIAQVKSGLHPAPVKGSRNAKCWYPHNHAALTSPESLLGEVSESAQRGQSEDDFTPPSDLYVVEEGGTGEVAEAELERLLSDHADVAENPPAALAGLRIVESENPTHASEVGL